jgi:hypothetical protein
MNKALILAALLGVAVCDTELAQQDNGWTYPTNGAPGKIVNINHIFSAHYQVNLDFGIETTFSGSSANDGEDVTS